MASIASGASEPGYRASSIPLLPGEPSGSTHEGHSLHRTFCLRLSRISTRVKTRSHLRLSRSLRWPRCFLMGTTFIDYHSFTWIFWCLGVGRLERKYSEGVENWAGNQVHWEQKSVYSLFLGLDLWMYNDSKWNLVRYFWFHQIDLSSLSNHNLFKSVWKQISACGKMFKNCFKEIENFFRQDNVSWRVGNENDKFYTRWI